MKAYKIEISFFCGAEWDNKNITIISDSRISLIKEFLKQTKFATNRRNSDATYVKDIFKVHKIQEIDLKFPLVYSGNYDSLSY